MRFFSEARRRRVFRTAGLYAVAAAGIWGAAEVAVDGLGLPSQALTFVVVTTIVGFPFALVLSWFFQVQTDAGSSSTGPGLSHSRAIALGLTAAIVAFVGLATSVAMRDGNGSRETDLPAFDRRQITFFGNARDPSVSPDGRYVAFHATFGAASHENPFTDSLLVVAPGETEPRALTAMVRNPTYSTPRRILWSTDGSEVWFLDFEEGDFERPVWRAVPFEGGDSRDIRNGNRNISPSPGGERVILPDPVLLGKSNVLKPNLNVVSLVTGEETEVELEDATGFPVMVDWSPDGDHVAVLVSDLGTDLYEVWSVSLSDPSSHHRLAQWRGGATGGIQWSRDGRSVFYDRNGRLWRVDVDLSTGRSLLEDGGFTGHDLTGTFSLSRDGRRLVVEQRLGGSNLWAFPIRNDSILQEGTQLTRGVFFRAMARLSPDDSRVASPFFEDESMARGRGISIVEVGGMSASSGMNRCQASPTARCVPRTARKPLSSWPVNSRHSSSLDWRRGRSDWWRKGPWRPIPGPRGRGSMPEKAKFRWGVADRAD